MMFTGFSHRRILKMVSTFVTGANICSIPLIRQRLIAAAPAQETFVRIYKVNELPPFFWF